MKKPVKPSTSHTLTTQLAAAREALACIANMPCLTEEQLNLSDRYQRGHAVASASASRIARTALAATGDTANGT